MPKDDRLVHSKLAGRRTTALIANGKFFDASAIANEFDEKADRG